MAAISQAALIAPVIDAVKRQVEIAALFNQRHFLRRLGLNIVSASLARCVNLRKRESTEKKTSIKNFDVTSEVTTKARST